MLPEKIRLKKEGFDLLKNLKGVSVISRFFSIKKYNTGFKPSRFAVVVPVSVFKKATQRNKTKRRVRSILIKNTKEFKEGFAIVVYPKKEEALNSFSEVEKDLVCLFKKANILK